VRVRLAGGLVAGQADQVAADQVLGAAQPVVGRGHVGDHGVEVGPAEPVVVGLDVCREHLGQPAVLLQVEGPAVPVDGLDDLVAIAHWP
jgi:hypothetical protein